jgi:hypothetical protein
MPESSFNTSPSGLRIGASAFRVREADPIEGVNAAIRSVLAGLGQAARPVRQDAEIHAEKLLALRHAEALPSAIREVRIAPGTVVTPLARDFLRRQGIALRAVSRSEVEARQAKGAWGFAIEIERESGTVASWQRTLLEEGWFEVDSAERWVIGRPDHGALIVTEDAATAVWRACQVAGIRAAAAVDPNSVARAVRSLGANLLVIEPAGKSIAFLKHMSRTFRSAGAPQAPAWLTLKERACESPR